MRLVVAAAFAALFASAFATSALAAPAAASPDPRDAEIAQLQARLADDQAIILALKRQREQCRDEEATSLAQALLAQAQQQARRDPGAVAARAGVDQPAATPGAK